MLKFMCGLLMVAHGMIVPLWPFAVKLLSCVWLFAIPWTEACQASLLCLPEFAQIHACPLSWWCSLIISSSAMLFSFCLQSFAASRSFPVSGFFATNGQSIGASTSASFLIFSRLSERESLSLPSSISYILKLLFIC